MTPWRGSRPSGAKLGREGVERGAGEAAEGEGRGDIHHASVAGRDGLGAGKGAGEVAVGEGEQGGRRTAARRRRRSRVRIMSSMGRMPAIGSLAKGKAMATAPASFPSI